MSFVKDKICGYCKEPMLDLSGEHHTSEHGWIHKDCHTAYKVTQRLDPPKLFSASGSAGMEVRNLEKFILHRNGQYKKV